MHTTLSVVGIERSRANQALRKIQHSIVHLCQGSTLPDFDHYCNKQCLGPKSKFSIFHLFIIRKKRKTVAKKTSCSLTETPPTLPIEIIIMIVEHTINNLIDQMIQCNSDDDIRPASIVKDYASLILSCKVIKKIVYETWKAVSIVRDYRGSLVWWRDEEDAPEPFDCIPYTYESFPEVIRDFQLARLQHDLQFGHNPLSRHVTKFGKFYLNPAYTVREAQELIESLHEYQNPTSEFLFKLGPFINRRRQTTKKANQKKNQRSFEYLAEECSRISYDLGEIKNIINNDGKLWAVENWSCQEDETISSSEITDEVKEWWVWSRRNEFVYFLGFSGGRVWVFDGVERILHTTFAKPEFVGKSMK